MATGRSSSDTINFCWVLLTLRIKASLDTNSDHVRPETFAHPAETNVRHIFHRCQQYRLFSQINIPDFHAYFNYVNPFYILYA